MKKNYTEEEIQNLAKSTIGKSFNEIEKIFSDLGMRVCNSYADFTGKPSSDHDIQLMVYSVRS